MNLTRYASQKYKIYCHQMCSFKLQMQQNRFRSGMHPDSAGGSLRRSPRPPSQLGRGHPSSYSSFLHAFGISLSYHLDVLSPAIKSSGYAYIVREERGLNNFCRGPEIWSYATVCEVLWSNHTVGRCVFIVKATVIYNSSAQTSYPYCSAYIGWLSLLPRRTVQ